MKHKTELRNGKFYRNGKEVPLKVGDPEQIALLRAEGMYHHEPELEPEEIKEILYDGLDLSVFMTVTYNAEFTCLCGRIVRAEFEDDAIGYPREGDIDEEEISCACGKEYEVYAQGQKVKLKT